MLSIIETLYIYIYFIPIVMIFHTLKMALDNVISVKFKKIFFAYFKYKNYLLLQSVKGFSNPLFIWLSICNQWWVQIIFKFILNLKDTWKNVPYIHVIIPG